MLPFDANLIPANPAAYLVGGSVRDLLLEHSPHDFDLVVDGDPEQFAAVIASRLGGRSVKLGRGQQAVYRIVKRAFSFDVAALNGRTIREDLKRRDFTINAMAMVPHNGRLVDPFKGREDLDRGLIRLVSPRAFSDDPLRMLRALRFGARLNFELDADCLKALRSGSGLIVNCAGERIRMELWALMQAQRSYPYLRLMEQSGLLAVLLPELERARECSQNDHHQYDVLEHTLTAYRHLEDLLTNSARRFARVAPQLLAPTETLRQAWLKCAMLLHDIGKPAVKTVDETDQIRFHGHAREGARLAVSIAHRWRLASREVQYLTTIVGHHLRPLLLYLDHRQGRLTRKGITRFFNRLDRYTPDLLLHAIADWQGKAAGSTARERTFVGFAEQLMRDYTTVFTPRREAHPLVTGQDLIERFGLTPSPRFKTILDRVELEKRTGGLKTKDEALKLVAGIITNEKRPGSR